MPIPFNVLQHYCDIAALAAALMIIAQLNINSKLFVGDTVRTDCDLNRIVCRSRPYRKSLALDR